MPAPRKPYDPRTLRRAGIALLTFGSLLVSAASCQEPTQVYLLLRSDMPCGVPSTEGYGVREVGVYVAPDEATLNQRIRDRVPSALLRSCKGPGDLGSIALVRENSDEVFVKVIASLDQRLDDGSQAPIRNVADCPSEAGDEKASARCLVASRRFQYARNNTRYLPLTLEELCVPKWWQCPVDPLTKRRQTCINNTCQSSDVPLVSEPPPPYTVPDAGTKDAAPRDAAQPVDAGTVDTGVDTGVDAGPIDYPTDISLGDFHSCALYKSGDVRCWGYGAYGAIGQGDTGNVGISATAMQGLPRIDLPKGDPAIAISAGGLRTCATLKNGRLMCWGWDGGEFGVPAGVLGYQQATSEPRGDGPGEIAALPGTGVLVGKVVDQVSVSLGGHTCAWKRGGNALCWGTNDHGQLGLGDTLNRLGGVPGLGNLDPIFPNGSAITQVAAGTKHTCAIANQRVLCWGINSAPHLGVLGVESNDGNKTPVDVALPSEDVLQIAAGHYHTCALSKKSNSQNAVRCWGTNDYGQLGTDSQTYYGAVPGNYGTYQVAPMASLPEVDFGGGLDADQIAAGPFHTCARLKSRPKKVVCWGRNTSGQLGYAPFGDYVDCSYCTGHNTARAVSKATPLAFPSDVVRIAAGGDNVSGRSHTCALLADHSIWCWGNNGDRVASTIPRFGQLGVGTPASEVAVPTITVAPILPP